MVVVIVLVVVVVLLVVVVVVMLLLLLLLLLLMLLLLMLLLLLLLAIRIFRILSHITVTRKPSPTHLFYVVCVPQPGKCKPYQFSSVLNFRIRFRQPEVRERLKLLWFRQPEARERWKLTKE